MKRQSIFLAVVFLVCATTSWAEPETSEVDREASAKQVANAWFSALLGGDTAVANSLSAVPFDLDGKRTIESHEDLRTIYKKVVEKKGKRTMEPKSIEVTESSKDAVVVRITVPDDDGGSDDESINITVKPGPAFYVVGFID